VGWAYETAPAHLRPDHHYSLLDYPLMAGRPGSESRQLFPATQR
jgi:hypothetical protein